MTIYIFFGGRNYYSKVIWFKNPWGIKGVIVLHILEQLVDMSRIFLQELRADVIPTITKYALAISLMSLNSHHKSLQFSDIQTILLRHLVMTFVNRQL